MTLMITLQTLLKSFDRLTETHKHITKAFTGLGGGAACLCGTAGLDVLSAQSCIRLQTSGEKVLKGLIYLH